MDTVEPRSNKTLYNKASVQLVNKPLQATGIMYRRIMPEAEILSYK